MIWQPQRTTIPTDPGVYFFKKGVKILYIGKAANLRKRLVSYWRKNAGVKVLSLLREATKVGWQTTDSEIGALLLEAELIKKNLPQFNVVMRDDKNYFYVGITKEEFPRIFITHQPSQNKKSTFESRASGRGKIKNRNDKSKFKIEYVGPFTSGSALKTALKLLRRLFPYCTCKMPHTRPCLNSQIGRCLGFCCSKKLNHESPVVVPPRRDTTGQAGIMNYGLYGKNIKSIIAVLSGKKSRLLSTLKKEMGRAARGEDFENAARLRDQIAGLKNIFAHAHIGNYESRIRNHGRMVWYKIERSIREILGTARPISRVEGYDISNISGTEATGSMVVFIDGKPAKSEYRKFKIRTVKGANDVAMHREVIRRRLARREWPLPDLILIDGGKPQLNAALRELRIGNYESRILLAALAKREEELYSEGRKSPIRLSSLPEATALFFQHVRNESHRFAKKYHHVLRAKTFRIS